MLYPAHYFFLVFHTALVLFNLFGWLVPRWRKWHLFSLLITLFSWVILGFWKGFGYCFLTDWHYRVLFQMGYDKLPESYISFLISYITGWIPDEGLVNTLTLIFTVLALGCSLWVNFSKRTFNK
ncbi:DUF2784 domain-containing protein [Sinomicrobium weinanense]|uniref:DUF2784 domain-containing protein n=1 Tax=Sinomicrobium weinanense TaxID=2842200 RepID=A0A926JVF8_9FLAO|nr:DUF2784 domain-containing protein [Sinomicrobium weinanense]MBC9797928.1 DUF2784 domain-containing protein [Sinomicrobium weinanense]MBU3123183.1 DUF2784 domain-containing protein [Sinomicrobium weinanense]